MKVHSFIFHILQKMQDCMEGEASVSLQEVVKNNGVIFTGLTFTQENINISPTIYLEEFYHEYEEGRSMEEIIEEIKEIYYRSKLENNINMEFFTEYEKAKSNIVYKLIHYEKNAELLKEIPHRKFLDLAIVYYYLVNRKEFTNATILIHNRHAEGWKVDEEELYKIARTNNPGLLPVNFCGMMDVLRELTEDDYLYKGRLNEKQSSDEGRDVLFDMEMHIHRDETGMYVLSNSSRMFGASVILYDGVLETCAERLGGSFYILPSSVHEVILVQDEERITTDNLARMVREVNETQLEEQEFLSNSVYYYSVETKRIVRL
ncbi:MAG: hypothetical protein IJZ42_08880 [Lachnospiraceae bacterium]|nr:hypothetical protein [Lachnospiraceae bacterium]